MRLLRPGVVIFGIALLASMSVHLRIYSALGVLAEVILGGKGHGGAHEAEFEVVAMGGDDVSEDAPPADDAEEPEEERLAAEPEPPRRPPPAVEEPESSERPPTLVELVEVPSDSPVKPDPEFEEKLAVKQRSHNPDVEPPPDARFIAEENRRVVEETVAMVRSMHRDDSDPSPGPEGGVETGEYGDSRESESADLREMEGEEERSPTAQEAEFIPRRISRPSAGERNAPAVPKPGVAEAQASARRSRPVQPGGTPHPRGEDQALTVEDMMGTFRVLRGRSGRPTTDDPGVFGNGGRSSKPGREAGSGAPGKGADLRLSWSQFEDTFGAEELRQQREAYLQQRRSRTRGGGGRRWRRFRAAIENFVPNVRPGNQTALNAAASPFADFIAAAHRRIHREFAHRFIRSLPIASGPFSDSSLHTTLEIVFNRDGSVHKIGVVRSSGFLPFDYGAFEAVLRAQPYTEPPPQILSGDGRVYVHWGFYRNQRFCGTFNVTPFILPRPPGTPKRGDGIFRDPESEREPGSKPGPGPG